MSVHFIMFIAQRTMLLHAWNSIYWSLKLPSLLLVTQLDSIWVC